MPRQFGNYSQLFERIQEQFDPSQLTKQNLIDYFGIETSGRLGLAEQLSQIQIIDDLIISTDNLQDLKDLQKEINKVIIHKTTLTNRLNERINQVQIEIRESEITKTITLTQDFAKERGITLSDKTKGGVYQNWGRYHRPAVVIFKNGKIFKWKYIK